KGPVALFVLIIPFLSIIKREEKLSKIILINFYVIFAFSASIAIMLTISQDSVYFFSQYFNKQVMASIYGKREIATSRFTMLYTISRDLIVPCICGGLLTAVVYRREKIAPQSINYRLFWYYMGIALVGSLPMLISPKQRRWYVFPSFPF